MRLNLWLGLVPLAIGSLAIAQPAAAAATDEAAPATCDIDSDCSTGLSCVDAICIAMPVDDSFKGLIGRFRLTLGLSTFGELFPVSSEQIPNGTRGQLSLLGGTRFSIGTRLPSRFRAMLVIEAGYGMAGVAPGRGADGVLEGAGVELSLDYFRRVKPYVRFMYNARVVPIRTSPEGTLAPNAFYVSAGARIRIVEIHLSFGRDFAGGISPGFGFALGWLY